MEAKHVCAVAKVAAVCWIGMHARTWARWVQLDMDTKISWHFFLYVFLLNLGSTVGTFTFTVMIVLTTLRKRWNKICSSDIL